MSNCMCILSHDRLLLNGNLFDSSRQDAGVRSSSRLKNMFPNLIMDEISNT